MLPTISQNLTLQEAFETTTQINEKLKRTELDGAFGKKFKHLLIDFLKFLTRRRKSIEKIIHQKNNRGYPASKTNPD